MIKYALARATAALLSAVAVVVISVMSVASAARPDVNPVCFAMVNTGPTVFSSTNSLAIQQAIGFASNGDLLKLAGACAGVQPQAAWEPLPLMA